mgnify:FL=1
MQYVTNVKLWLIGWSRFDEIIFKKGWSGRSPRWWLIYGLDYGTCCLCGCGVQSWSRFWYWRSQWMRVGSGPSYRKDSTHELLNAHHCHRFSAFMTRLLDRLESDGVHGAQTGSILFGSVNLWK